MTQAGLEEYGSLIVLDEHVLKVEGREKDPHSLTLEHTLKHILRGNKYELDEITKEMVHDFLNSLIHNFEEPIPKYVDHYLVDKPVRSTKAFTKFSAADFLDIKKDHYLVPSAIVYRPDLIPESYNDCGEFRIVYSFRRPLYSPLMRMFLIFETRPPNPISETGSEFQPMRLQACQEIAQFWKSLEAEDEDSGATKRQRLADFFYRGMPAGNQDISERAMKAEHLGGDPENPLGQIRGNILSTETLEDSEIEFWQLREWVVEPIELPSAGMIFRPEPLDEVKS